MKRERYLGRKTAPGSWRDYWRGIKLSRYSPQRKTGKVWFNARNLLQSLGIEFPSHWTLQYANYLTQGEFRARHT